jgi:hypothetical protein
MVMSPAGFSWLESAAIVNNRPILSSDYELKGSVGKKYISGREPKGAWRQDQFIGSKPPVVK